MNAGTKDPNRGISSLPIIGRWPTTAMRDHGGQKWLGRLDDVRELHRPLSILYRMKFARDWFARRDTFQKLYAHRFLHCKVYARFRESCSSVRVPAPSAIILPSFSGEADPTQGGTRYPQRVE